MSLAGLEDELRREDGKRCVRPSRHEDGTVLTRDCPVGLRKIRMRMAAALLTAPASRGPLQ